MAATRTTKEGSKPKGSAAEADDDDSSYSSAESRKLNVWITGSQHKALRHLQAELDCSNQKLMGRLVEWFVHDGPGNPTLTKKTTEKFGCRITVERLG